ncbi:hypothetical protein BDB00DRAFT_292411 [Zychaea mexicana]|uniref:uncharacterized protein n=1 Tax=Zychaea mexicana TaxID=64656 RepID=UPI0022FE5934|nr:uncharacterized protein BDB00DRAFT_292411 [Zychaea mexicana]KAI9494825.1 hypothetical protein BDB00DRAFT_292411 [Zychaea mexicana]
MCLQKNQNNKRTLTCVHLLHYHMYTTVVFAALAIYLRTQNVIYNLSFKGLYTLIGGSGVLFYK